MKGMDKMMEFMQGGMSKEERLELMGKMMKMGAEGGEQMEMGKMMTEMMPMCLNMMLPRLPKKEREDFALRLFAVLADKTCGGMSDEERRQFRESVLAVI